MLRGLNLGKLVQHVKADWLQATQDVNILVLVVARQAVVCALATADYHGNLVLGLREDLCINMKSLDEITVT